MLNGLDVDFLLTNDDGIEAEGLVSLVQAIAKVGSFAVVAPDTVRSCCSHAVTTAEALSIHRLDAKRWKVSGTPADCVKLSKDKILHRLPDIVLSGINHGSNSYRPS